MEPAEIFPSKKVNEMEQDPRDFSYVAARGRPPLPADQRKSHPMMLWVEKRRRDAFDSIIPHGSNRSETMLFLINSYLKQNGIDPVTLKRI